jgi:hypothetical protein
MACANYFALASWIGLIAVNPVMWHITIIRPVMPSKEIILPGTHIWV